MSVFQLVKLNNSMRIATLVMQQDEFGKFDTVSSTTILLSHLLPNQNFSIVKDEYGKPYFKPSIGKYLSISHTKNILTILLSNNNCGIDIQTFEPKVKAISTKFLSITELSFIDTSDEILHLTLCWAAKEAIYKWYGKKKVDFIKHIQLHEYQPDMLNKKGTLSSTFCLLNLHQEIKLEYLYTDEWVLVYTT